MRGGHDSNHATVAAGALGTCPVPASAVSPSFSARTTTPSVPRAKLLHLARPRPYKSAPAGLANPPLWRLPEVSL